MKKILLLAGCLLTLSVAARQLYPTFAPWTGMLEKGVPVHGGETTIPPSSSTKSFEPEMVVVQGGTFWMGSPLSEADRNQDETLHQVTLSSFQVGKYEVTQGEWEAVMGSNPSHFKNGDNCPVENVSWNDVQEFLWKVNAATGKQYRLPTEAEWEYACRAGTMTPFNTGSNLATWQANCNLNDSIEVIKHTQFVSNYSPNAWGIYNMHGNVGEWCSDWYGNYPDSVQINPQGAFDGSIRVERGGGFRYPISCCRSAFRYGRAPGYRSESLGFRVVAPAYSVINITSNPDNADVYIDGEKMGNTPYSGKDFSSGKYQVTIKKNGYVDAEKEILVKKAETITESFTLQKKYSVINITSNPDNADVYIDGEKVGDTPYSGKNFSSGKYQVTIKKNGYVDTEKEISVKEAETITESFTLQKKYSVINITSSPNNADVYIDGKKMGNTPYSGKDFSSGRYKLIIKKNGYVDAEKEISVKEAETITESFTLKKKATKPPTPTYSVINITSNPNNADVYINGKKMGVTPYSNKNISKGKHKVTIKKNGYVDIETEISVKEAETIIESFTLQEKEAVATVSSTPSPIHSLTLEMVHVEGGTFTMGSPKSEPGRYDNEVQHQVTVSSFHIGKYEVTQGQWKAVMGDNPSGFKKGDNYPVENVSWNDVQGFLRKLNAATGKHYRLPTEAEWEYAARGGNYSRGCIYSGSNSVGNVAWYSDNSGSSSHPVGQKSPNELGIYDMSGNVWEWCSDWYGSYSTSAQTNPTGPSSGSNRVLRGGSWNINAKYCRSAFRFHYDPGYRFSNFGFRLVLP
ncbi:MAG: SUMF1/EgtB/PvdO family nonheme iron enzyme [Prevotellaceae bacterium]|jgi:formylglycine-generating enzyme required for sulfatase activity|nr:SUMF1/EgtB/PvdO family nonheme iron enzyme [Prevotellaceae bacterium]